MSGESTLDTARAVSMAINVPELAPFDPLRPGFLESPYSIYQRYRSLDPIHWAAAAEPEGAGCWYLFRYAEVAAVLKDARFGRELQRVLPPPDEPPQMPEEHRAFAEMSGLWMLFRDPPDHTRLRSLVNRAFTPRVVEGLKPRIAAIANELLDEVHPSGAMDLIADYAFLLPVIVIAEMLGVRSDDHRQFREWSNALAAAIDFTSDAEVYVRASKATLALTEYLQGLVAERRRRPQDDLISNLVAVQEQEGSGKLSDEELLSTCILLLVAGHETTVNLIGNGTLALLRHREQWTRLLGNPSGVTNAVEELLRFDSPVQITFRAAFEDVEVGGTTIKRGDGVGLVLGAANHDPAHFADPERLDVTRDVGVHSSFAFGIHFCLGAPLARAEGAIALATLLRRMPHLQLATDTLQWRANVALRGLQTLPVSF